MTCKSRVQKLDQKLIFLDEIIDLIKTAKNSIKYDSKMSKIVEAAKILRQDTLDHEGFKFAGHFENSCQKNPV